MYYFFLKPYQTCLQYTFHYILSFLILFSLFFNHVSYNPRNDIGERGAKLRSVILFFDGIFVFKE